jgi:hypothetical protein
MAALVLQLCQQLACSNVTMHFACSRPTTALQVLGSSTISSDLECLAEFDQQVENLLLQQQQPAATRRVESAAATRRAEAAAAPPAAAATCAAAGAGGEALQARMPQEAQVQQQQVASRAAAAAAANLAALDMSSSIETDPGRTDLEVRVRKHMHACCCVHVLLYLF